MLAYYPLEHAAYLVSHGVLPSSVSSPRALLTGAPAKRVRLDAARLGRWSVRCWAAYVFLQLAHLRADAQLLGARERALAKAKGRGSALAAERADVRRRWGALLNELVVNLAYLPLTLHWSVTHTPHPACRGSRRRTGRSSRASSKTTCGRVCSGSSPPPRPSARAGPRPPRRPLKVRVPRASGGASTHRGTKTRSRSRACSRSTGTASRRRAARPLRDAPPVPAMDAAAHCTSTDAAAVSIHACPRPASLSCSPKVSVVQEWRRRRLRTGCSVHPLPNTYSQAWPAPTRTMPPRLLPCPTTA
jgi:hypothetical protein